MLVPSEAPCFVVRDPPEMRKILPAPAWRTPGELFVTVPERMEKLVTEVIVLLLMTFVVPAEAPPIVKEVPDCMLMLFVTVTEIELLPLAIVSDVVGEIVAPLITLFP